jgi:hypothetical protein
LDASENLHILARGREQKDGSRLASNFGKVDYRAGGAQADGVLSFVHLYVLGGPKAFNSKTTKGNRGLSGFSFLL